MCECLNGHPTVITDWACGDMVCCGCGVVLESHVMDESAEWRDWPVVVSSERHHHQPAAKRRRTRTLDDTRELWAAEGLRDVDRVVSCFGQSTTGAIAARARELFTDLATCKQGSNGSCDRGALVAAAAYYAFKIEGVGRELQTVCDACDVAPTHMRAALDEYKERLVGKPYYSALFSRVTADALLNVALDKLVAAGALDASARKEVWRLAMRLLDRLGHVMDCGRKPKTLCCGIVYLAAQQHLAAQQSSQKKVAKKDVAAACGVCQQTLDKIVAYIRARDTTT